MNATDEMETGKRYRYTVEGIAEDGWTLRISNSYCLTTMPLLAGDLEQLNDPLPTTPGSVVSYHGELLMRVESETGYVWAKPKGNSDAYWGDSELAGATVLFDAGAVPQ